MKTIEMKRTLSILCLLSFSLFMNGQQATGYTKTRNYTAERTYMDASSQTGSGGARIVSDIVYTDCFGRKEQEIQVGGSPGGNADLVLSYTYNMMGQVEKEYLPVTTVPLISFPRSVGVSTVRENRHMLII